MSDSSPQAIETRIDLIISRLLRWGVVLSLVLLVVGTVAGFGEGRGDTHALTNAHRDGPHSLAGVFRFEGDALITLGLIVLLATPVLRVAVSIVAFAIEKDRAFVIITSVVLALLGVSVLVGA